MGRYGGEKEDPLGKMGGYLQRKEAWRVGVKVLEGFQSCFARDMAMEISYRKGEFVEKSHCW